MRNGTEVHKTELMERLQRELKDYHAKGAEIDALSLKQAELYSQKGDIRVNMQELEAEFVQSFGRDAFEQFIRDGKIFLPWRPTNEHRG